MTLDFVVPKEHVVTARSCKVIAGSPSGVQLRTFVSEACGATGLSTGTATFRRDSFLPHHMHCFSEAVTVLAGQARVLIEDRAYILEPRDCIHIPANIPHLVQNENPAIDLVAHWAFATDSPKRELIEQFSKLEVQILDSPSAKDPEHIVRFDAGAIYELTKGAFFCDLFASRFGAVGICGGYATFVPGASLPCHTHNFDESITIVQGEATCLVQGRRYELRDCDTAFVPKGLPHRFLNTSEEEMAMVWVYAGDEPDRTLVDAGLCSGTIGEYI